MGFQIKLPPRKCEDCGYSASGGAFRREFLRWWFGKERCPKCKSKNIIDSEKPSVRKKDGKRWKKIEDKSNGTVLWTEYTDFDGNVYTIYNMIPSPGFSGAHLKEE